MRTMKKDDRHLISSVLKPKDQIKALARGLERIGGDLIITRGIMMNCFDFFFCFVLFCFVFLLLPQGTHGLTE